MHVLNGQDFRSHECLSLCRGCCCQSSLVCKRMMLNKKTAAGRPLSDNNAFLPKQTWTVLLPDIVRVPLGICWCWPLLKKPQPTSEKKSAFTSICNHHASTRCRLKIAWGTVHILMLDNFSRLLQCCQGAPPQP